METSSSTHSNLEIQDLRAQNDLLGNLINELRQSVKKLAKQNEALRHTVERQAKEIEQLKSEIRRLKKLKQKPKISPSKMNKDDKQSNKDSPEGKRAGSYKKSKRHLINTHQKEILKVENLPQGAKFKGYQEYLVQGLEIQVKNTLFKLERWQLPDGTYKVAELPEGIKGHHFSVELRAYILHQHHHQGVRQPLLLSQLREWGIDISSGQLNRILTEDKEDFHKEGTEVFATPAAWLAHLKAVGITSEHNQRIATEGAMIGSLLHHGFPMDRVILSDDAGQFNLFNHALCWIHSERKIIELIGNNESQNQVIQDARTSFWRIYKALKLYKKEPSIEAKKQIEKDFDDFVDKQTEYITLNLVLKRIKKNKKELLLVLARPEIPLHNNLSEGDIREYVKKRKISGSTRSEEGRRCRDTFASLKKTCKKLGVRFWDYLVDRLSKENAISSLNILMTEKVATT